MRLSLLSLTRKMTLLWTKISPLRNRQDAMARTILARRADRVAPPCQLYGLVADSKEHEERRDSDAGSQGRG